MDAPRERPAIRHATPADVDAVVRIFSGPKVIRGTIQLPLPSPQTWRQRLTEPERGLIPMVAELRGEVVGMLGIHTRPDQPRTRHAATLGMAVRDDFQGQGVGTALMAAAVDLADRWLNLSRLELNVLTDNLPALRLYRRFGFETEGTLRQAVFCDGTFRDVLVMGRLRPAAGPADADPAPGP